MQRRAFIMLVPALALLGCTSQPAQQPVGGLRFSEEERRIIDQYYAQIRGRKPGPQPAQMARPGEKLAPGLRPTKLPTDLDNKLPALAHPHTRLVLGADVILVNRDTHDILDVIPQVAY
jgi:hypothetical protein